MYSHLHVATVITVFQRLWISLVYVALKCVK